MDPFDKILSFSQTLTDDDPKIVAQRELEAANEMVAILAKTRPDDKDMLAEDQESWAVGWKASLSELHRCLLAACGCGIEPFIKPSAAKGMQESKHFFAKWTAEVEQRKRAVESHEQECCKDHQLAHKESSPEVRNTADEAPTETVRVDEGPVQCMDSGSTLQEHHDESANASGQTDSNAGSKVNATKTVSVPPTMAASESGEVSGTSGAMRAYVEVPARTKRSRIILDDDEDEEDEDPRPVKKTTSGLPIVTHKTRCKACTDRSELCRGPKGRTCFVCAKLKIKCNKSPGRTRAQKATEEEGVADRKGKGNVAARPTCVRREVEEPIELVDTDEEETLKKVSRAKVQPTEQVADQVHDVGVRAVKRLEAKILKNQARMKAAEADMAEMGAEVDSQRVELDVIKRALGMNTGFGMDDLG
ncbi:hypothetical protein L210DRAFT_3646281 [Boletus edulis BED1]|uniref:Zn(2)-C6 fungal-type domain-containing protein n=1 Tax=Boletus edulis BED1 TaxID=1328754 RepID=A0AAD4BTG0_BOLED|nr:hypothetical protein L210DRAFT_3646281 [Boletus edulis BED1]